MAVTDLHARYASVVGEERVLTHPEALSAYATDITENPAGQVDMVVKPTSAEQVQEIVRLAGEESIPLTPAVARMNVGGLAIPSEGGIVVDMTDMNRVIELDRDHMLAVIEPGVTFQQITDLLKREAPELTISYPLAPPYTSIVANFLMDGLGNLSLLHGAAGEQIGGLEAVLPDGTLVRTGAGAVSPLWFSRSPLPDLTGLFLNFQGSSGIVTKMAVQLWPMLPLTRRMFIFSERLEGSWDLIRELTRREICRDMSGISWPTAKMLFGVDNPLVNDPGEPVLFISFDVGGHDEEEVAYKERTARKIVAEHEKRGLPVAAILSIEELVEVAPTLARFAEFPMTLDFLLDHPGGGLTWIGTYGPTASWDEGARRCYDLMLERGFPPLLVTRPMKGGHYGVLRMISLFDKQSEEEIEKVKRLNADLFEICLELGFVPYKAPGWAVEQMRSRTDPGFQELLRRVKETLDPQGIMNPGRWGL
jgi:FAD/FMN-containing dehydrogenase